MSSLLNITNFGGIDADTDPLLDRCFEDHEAYLLAKRHERFLLVGRKGSGKTAIFRNILKEQTHRHDAFSFGHTFRDYPWYHHDKQRQTGVPDEECYLHSWKYLICITLAKIILNQDSSQPWDETSSDFLSSLESFVIDTYGSRDPDVSQIFQPHTKVKINAKLGFNLGAVSAGVNPILIDMPAFPTLVADVNRSLQEKIIASLNPDNDYYVLFDELDLGLSMSDPNYKLRLIGLILAARDINIRARETCKKLTIVVFLRDDIYQLLKFEDKNKISHSGLERIEWDSQRSNRTLKEVMERRFSTLLNIPQARAWEAVFDETQEMTGHQNKYQHIIARTMLRPRDIIKFCNEILQSYRRRGIGSEKFKNIDVSNARPEYSRYLIEELDDEIHKHMPDSGELLETLRDLQAINFTFEEFEQAFRRRGGTVHSGSDPRRALGELFEFSVVGFYRQGGGGYGGSEYVFLYKEPRALFNANASGYQIHLGLQESLGLKRFRRTT